MFHPNLELEQDHCLYQEEGWRLLVDVLICRSTERRNEAGGGEIKSEVIE